MFDFLKDLSENKLGVHGAESMKDILLHNSNITRFTANGETNFQLSGQCYM